MTNGLETLDALVARIRAGFEDSSEEICRKIEDIHSRAGHPRALDRIDQARFLSALYTIVRTLRMSMSCKPGLV